MIILERVNLIKVAGLAGGHDISQEDIDSVRQRGSGFQNGKYHIYRQFQKNEDSKNNIDYYKKEYGTGGGTHYFPDGTQGHAWYDGKGIAKENSTTAFDENAVSLRNPDFPLFGKELIRADFEEKLK